MKLKMRMRAAGGKHDTTTSVIVVHTTCPHLISLQQVSFFLSLSLPVGVSVTLALEALTFDDTEDSEKERKKENDNEEDK